MAVISRPSPVLKNLFLKGNAKNIDSDAIFFPYGRDALIYGLKLKKIKKGSTIIIPAYMCKSTLEPLIDYGFKIHFQDINHELNLDLNLLRENIKKFRAQAVLVVNYFGFESNISEISKLCSELKIISIEDCSHSYLSYGNFYKPIRSNDFTIYSIRKSLPIYDGGAIRFKNNTLIDHDINTNNSLMDNLKVYCNSFKYLISRFLELLILKIKVINIYSDSITKIKFLIRKSVQFSKYKDRHYKANNPVRPSPLLTPYLNNKDLEIKIKLNVIKNYTEIVEGMKNLGFRPLYPHLPDKCIPQYAVFFDDSERLYMWLRNNKIGASQWPNYEIPEEVVDNPSFPKANLFNRKLVMIPIHQSINSRHCKNILDIISEWN